MKSVVCHFIAVPAVLVLTLAAQTSPRFTHTTAAPSLAVVTPEQLQNVSSGSLPMSAPALAPRIFFTDVETGPVSGGPNGLGVPISIFGKGFGTVRGTGRVTIGGVEVAGYLIWGANNAHNQVLDMIVVQPGSKVKGGAIVVTVNNNSSNSDFSFTPNSGAIHYVAPGGSDNGGCSSAHPCATIQYAASVMRPGDTVLVRGGTSAEGEIWIRAEQGGIAGQPKTIKNYPGEEVHLSNSARDFMLDADSITVSGLTFLNGKGLTVTGWASRDQKSVKFVNNVFRGKIGYAAIEITGNDHIIAGNVCDVSDSSVGTMGHCFYVTQGKNVKILYNVAGGAPGYGLHIYDERRATADFRRVISNVLVEGNILRRSAQRSGMIVSMSDSGYGNFIEGVIVRNNILAENNHNGIVVSGLVRNVKIYNNTFYQNGRQAIFMDDDRNIANVDISNNLLYQSENSNCKVECSYFPLAHIQVGPGAHHVTTNNNSYQPGSPILFGQQDTNPVTGAVRFADAGHFDFHLLAGSVAIDRGAALAEVPTDFDGVPRPQGAAYDIGAFEYQPEARTPDTAAAPTCLLALPLRRAAR